MTDDMRREFEEAKQHLFWLKENKDKTDSYIGRIVGYTECLEQWQAALQSLPRVTEEEVIKLVTESIHGSLDALVNSKYKAKQAINALKSAGYRIVRDV